MLLEQTLATLTSIVARHLPLALAGLVLVMGAVSCLCGKGQTPSPWVVRKGACPCCGSALFGTTLVYQHPAILILEINWYRPVIRAQGLGS